ncbi:MAG: histidine kinase [Lachnospiraceae bacterium]|nr:histidine kinase [Lachnospiraceae bacterium]
MIWEKLEAFMNDFNIRMKLIIIYVFCVILPLVLTDSVIFYTLYDAGEKEQIHEFENVTNSIHYDLEYTLEEIVNMMNDVYMNREVYEFLDKQYEGSYDFFEERIGMTRKSSLNRLGGYNISNAVLYADNDTIVNGGYFSRMTEMRDAIWYQDFLASGRNMNMTFYYIGEEDMSAPSKRRISLVRRMDYYRKKDSCEKILRVDVDYNRMAAKLTQLDYGFGIYICKGDRILFSNRGHSGSNEDFDNLTGQEEVAYRSAFSLYGVDIDVLCTKPSGTLITQLKKHIPLMAFLFMANLFLPFVMFSMMNNSFTRRLRKLGEAFDMVEEEAVLQEISQEQGRDEIGALMQNYNRMVRRMNELIQKVYKDRLERQEIDLARQNAELLALHSQINPHFLFNILESIRMHSVLRNEEETAGMIEKLAVLERQNINWASDNVKLSEEISFVEAYLELQKYRFGDRLHYQIELAESCTDYYIPKLTLTTFVENSCVHGMERKSAACWIYLRVYEKGSQVVVEIEDTGDGMEESAAVQLCERMQNCTIDDIKENKHVGILNACLRLKRFSGEQASFSLESEPGVGTFTTIRVDAACLKSGKEEET